MYANAAVHFKDPFAARNSTLNRQPHHYSQPQASWKFPASKPEHSRALTPPPDMNGVGHASRPGVYQEQGKRYNDYTSNYPPYGASGPQYTAYEPPAASSHTTGTRSHTISPAPQARQSRLPPLDIHCESKSQSRRTSQNAIAPSFQIPKSVNDSGGSLSELAAQITCLFWFESSDILKEVEESSIAGVPSRNLVKDAIPTTGFRKWVTTILSTTLVAQNVVLLALLFVHRLKKLNPTVKGKPGSEYRLLTVALMLGNKFLDDNTYTNKTWAEVSGINVAEVHIMEVEFLSNMKYCLFTSAEDWAEWQSLLGRYASFFEKATLPRPQHNALAPILPPASSLHLPMALPSPPASTQASPPYAAQMGYNNGYNYSAANSHGPTPAPSPLPTLPSASTAYPESRKRSRDDYSSEPPAKRMASGLQDFTLPQFQASSSQNQRLTLPSLPIPSVSSAGSSMSQSHQLPPLNIPSRAMAMVYPSSSGQSLSHNSATAGPSSQPSSHYSSQYQSRQHSPYPGSAVASPTNGMPHSSTALQPPTQFSPSYFLQQRNSPYRPVHNVSTLLYPPPSAALQHRPQNIEFNQMRYQPLGKSVQQHQVGHLPYVAQNVWLEGNQQQAMTPVHQWPGFTGR